MVLSSAPKIPDNIITYRLVDDNFIRKLIINNKKNPYLAIQEKGFLSTSLSTNIVKSSQPYADYENLLKIYVRKNSIGVYVNAITSRKEQELLLYPGGHLALIRYPYINIILNKRIYECDLIYPECLYDY
ncbi:ADP-ribosyltransferase [Clostridioides difficile]|nr:ADP-ribosyltransferase [Clostridioides difficile]MCP8365780.1 ADP-ribosyltransferase [Clostridioides difficile]